MKWELSRGLSGQAAEQTGSFAAACIWALALIVVWNSGISEGYIVSSVVLVLASGEMDWNCQYLDVNFMLVKIFMSSTCHSRMVLVAGKSIQINGICTCSSCKIIRAYIPNQHDGAIHIVSSSKVA